MHYHTFEEAKACWLKRCARINKDNVFVMMTDRDGCTYEDLVRFDSLPFSHKVVFTHKYLPEIKSSFYIRGFENEKQVGLLNQTKNILGYRYIDEFDYVKFLNGEIYNKVDK